jgi:hypothetical protein
VDAARGLHPLSDLNDRILAAEAGEYDIDALEFVDPAAPDEPSTEEIA